MWSRLQPATTVVESVTEGGHSPAMRAAIWLLPLLVLAAITALIVVAVQRVGERR